MTAFFSLVSYSQEMNKSKVKEALIGKWELVYIPEPGEIVLPDSLVVVDKMIYRFKKKSKGNFKWSAKDGSSLKGKTKWKVYLDKEYSYERKVKKGEGPNEFYTFSWEVIKEDFLSEYFTI